MIEIGDFNGPLPYLIQENQTKQKQIAQQSTSGKEQFSAGGWAEIVYSTRKP